ncbi:hypothetical protein [Alkalicoccus urumqiensis]|nr:hypothetical protein [Alkalicoccus urumqiensis]
MSHLVCFAINEITSECPAGVKEPEQALELDYASIEEAWLRAAAPHGR